jgi:hypothetical protein
MSVVTTVKIQDELAARPKFEHHFCIGEIARHKLTDERIMVIGAALDGMHLTVRRANWDEIKVSPAELEPLTPKIETVTLENSGAPGCGKSRPVVWGDGPK